MDKTVQLFMLPYAGGNISSFNKLISCLDERIEAITVEYSGRGSRRGEGYITGYEPFVVDIINYIHAHRNTDLPYILFGYSMGSALVYDVIRSSEILATPILVIVCARGFVEQLVHGWSQITSGDSHFYEFSENHFFVNVYYKEMAEIINCLVQSMNLDSCI